MLSCIIYINEQNEIKPLVTEKLYICVIQMTSIYMEKKECTETFFLMNECMETW